MTILERAPFRRGALLLVGLLIAGAASLGACAKDEDAAEGETAEAEADATAADEAGDADAEATAEDEAEDDDEEARPERAVSVDVSEVSRGELVEPVLAEGTIRARRSAELKFELAGRVTRVYVKEGERVKRGQRLAALDDREYQVALEEARSNYLQSLGQLAVEGDDVASETAAQGELDRQLQELERMESRGEITRAERLKREMELGVSAVKDGAYRRELLEVRSGLASARASEARAELNLERTVVRAPFDGVVTGLATDPGERVQAGALLCTVVDDTDLEADIGVLESDLGSLIAGRPALLTIPALRETFPATVDVISPRIDATSRTCQVLLRIRSEDGRIKPGMFVRASIAGTVHRDMLMVPRAAILTRDGRPMLFKVDDERARWVYVELGAENERAVEIRRVLQGGPLDPGTPVVVDNHLTLTHDAKVKVRKRVPLDDPWASYAHADQP